MKSRTLPTLQVTPKLRRAAESVLAEDESLSAFMLDSVARNVEARRTQQALIARGLASAERARKSGRYTTAGAVLRKLSRRAAATRAARRRLLLKPLP
jgi:predicted transcriptional regulator